MNFNQTYQRYFADVLYFALYLLKNQEDAEDVAQEVFVKFLENQINEGSEKSWLIITTRNACFDKLKYNRRHPACEYDEDLDYRTESSVAELIEDTEVKAEVIRRLSKAIEKLPKKSRRVMQLSLRGLQPRHIAKITGMSEHTIWNQKHNAAKILRRKFFYGLGNGQGMISKPLYGSRASANPHL